MPESVTDERKSDYEAYSQLFKASLDLQSSFDKCTGNPLRQKTLSRELDVNLRMQQFYKDRLRASCANPEILQQEKELQESIREKEEQLKKLQWKLQGVLAMKLQP